MRLAILQQSYGRFGGAERLAFSHYVKVESTSMWTLIHISPRAGMSSNQDMWE